MTRLFRVLLVLAVVLVWSYMFIHSVRMEEREATRSEIMLDDTGRPVEVIWQEGKGYRLPTQEERNHAKR